MLSLPDELITLILVHLSEGPEIDESSWPLQSSSHTWLPLVRTCHRVHEVAVSAQHLWRRIDVFSKTRGLDTAFGRSGDLQIDVIFHRPHILPSAFMLLAPHAARVRTLIIFRADRNTDSELQSLFARPMPALTTCQIHLVHRNIPRRDPHREMRFTANFALLPNLRALQLGVLSLDWTSAMVPRLRRLSLWNSSPQVFLTFDRFLDVLQSCAALKHLEIRRSLPFMTPVLPTQRSVALPHLRTLILESYKYAEVSALGLSHLQLSEHVDLDINLDIDTDIEEEAALTLPHIIHSDPTQLPLLVSATSAFFAFQSCVHVECSAPARGPGRLHVSLNPTFATETDQGWQYTPSQAVAHFCALLARASLRKLELRLVWPYGEETCAASGTFAHVFQTFPEVEELAYGDSEGPDEASDRQFLDALAGGALPRLSVLWLKQWNEKLLPSLIEVLRTRKTRGLPHLSQLRIRGANRSEVMDEATLGALQQEVDEVGVEVE